MEPNIEPHIEKESGLGTASLVLGIISVCTSFIIIINNMSFIMGIIGVIFGIIAAVKSTKKGKAIAGIILGVLAIMFTLAYQASLINAINDFSNGLSKELNNISGDNTEEIIRKAVDVKIEKFVKKVDKYGFTDTELPVIVTNKSNEQKTFSIQIEAIDENGVRLDTDTIYISNLNPGQSVKEKAFKYVPSDLVSSLNKAQFKVVSISMY